MRNVIARSAVGNDKVQFIGYAAGIGYRRIVRIGIHVDLLTAGKRTFDDIIVMASQRLAVIRLFRAARKYRYFAGVHGEITVYDDDIVIYIADVLPRHGIDHAEARKFIRERSGFGDRRLPRALGKQHMRRQKRVFVIRIFFASQRSAVVFLFIAARSYLKRALCDRERTA